MKYHGMAFHWVYMLASGDYTCVFVAADSIILSRLKQNLELMGDKFFPVAMEEEK